VTRVYECEQPQAATVEMVGSASVMSKAGCFLEGRSGFGYGAPDAGVWLWFVLGLPDRQRMSLGRLRRLERVARLAQTRKQRHCLTRHA
jgi:hypothetical protein